MSSILKTLSLFFQTKQKIVLGFELGWVQGRWPGRCGNVAQNTPMLRLAPLILSVGILGKVPGLNRKVEDLSFAESLADVKCFLACGEHG